MWAPRIVIEEWLWKKYPLLHCTYLAGQHNRRINVLFWHSEAFSSTIAFGGIFPAATLHRTCNIYCLALRIYSSILKA
jgi:hypothetical protein